MKRPGPQTIERVEIAMAKTSPTPPEKSVNLERLYQVLRYEPDTGVFYWLAALGSRAKPGNIAGRYRADGYLIISIDGRSYLGHRLAWFYVHGVWPSQRIDHRDTDPSHNWIDNLREASQGMNAMNRAKSKNNRSGFKGVWLCRRDGRYQAQLNVCGRKRHLGYFDTPEEASAAYQSAAAAHCGEFTLYQGSATR